MYNQTSKRPPTKPGRFTSLIGEGRYEDAIETFDGLIIRFEDAGEPELRRLVAIGLINKSMALERLGRQQECLTVHEDMVARFGEEALMAFDEFIKRFGRTAEPEIREQLASALYNKAWILSELDRGDEALPVLAKLIASFKNHESLRVQLTVVRACEVRDNLLSNGCDDV